MWCKIKILLLMKSELRNNFSHLDALTNCIKEELLEVSNPKLRNVILSITHGCFSVRVL